MKKTRIAGLLALSVLTFAACKKNSSSPTDPGNTATGKLTRIQQGIDPDITNDTVYLISYNAAGKITSLIDSVNKDTLVPSYDNNGNLTAITDKPYLFNATFTYDGSNRLTQIDYYIGSNERVTFDYTNNVVSKKSQYSDVGGSGLAVENYYNYTVTSGNITDVKAYTANGTLIADGVITYSSQPNPFQQLSLFNYDNRLGLDDISSIESFFNKNIITGLTESDGTVTANLTYNSQQQPSKAVVTDNINDWLLTWQFTFK